MRTFRCRLIGNNFVLMTEDGPHRLGFYGLRDVIADKPEDAEVQAVEQIWLELAPRLLNMPEDPPSVSVESVLPVTGIDKVPPQPFTWMSENEEISS